MADVYKHDFPGSGVFLASSAQTTGAASLSSIASLMTCNSGYAYASHADYSAYRTSNEWSNVANNDLAYSIRAKYVSNIGTTTHVAAILINHVFDHTYYFCQINWKDGVVSIVKKISSADTVLATFDIGSPSVGNTYELTFVQRAAKTGSQTLEAWWEGVRVIAPFVDASIQEVGNAGILSYNDAGLTMNLSVGFNFDEFRVRNDLPTVSAARRRRSFIQAAKSAIAKLSPFRASTNISMGHTLSPTAETPDIPTGGGGQRRFWWLRHQRRR